MRLDSPGQAEGERPIHALLVCHAGAEIGLGHLTRSLVVADALRRHLAADVRLLIQGENVRRGALTSFAHRFVSLQTDLGRAIVDETASAKPELVIFDCHPRLLPADVPALLSSLRERRIRIIGVDCLLDHCNALDLVWIPSFHIDPARLAHCQAPVHFGWDSFLLRRTHRAGAWSPGGKVLVLTGGADVARLGRSLPDRLDAALPQRTEIAWVRGPYAPAPILPVSPRLQWRVLDAPEGLDDLIVETDYALTVFGVSCFELLQYGVPTVVFSPYGDKDDLELAGLAEEQVAWVADGAEEAVQRLRKLMADDSAAALLAQRSVTRLSVRGADRLAERVRTLFG